MLLEKPPEFCREKISKGTYGGVTSMSTLNKALTFAYARFESP
jgi:hypothetical protein